MVVGCWPAVLGSCLCILLVTKIGHVDGVVLGHRLLDHFRSLLVEMVWNDYDRKQGFESNPSLFLQSLIFFSRHILFLQSLSEVKTSSFLTAATQLCHYDTKLAHKVWCKFFPKLWAVLTDRQQTVSSVCVLVIYFKFFEY